MTEQEATKTQAVPWREGFFKLGIIKALVLQTSGSNQFKVKNLIALDYPEIEAGSSTLDCSFGDFGDARQEIADATGVKTYNMDIRSLMMNTKGVLNEDGTKITVWGMTNSLEEWIWMDDAMIEEVKNDREDFEAPSCPHITPKPDHKGKVIWISGNTGSGKSTTCQLMAREKGFTYYEADCTSQLVNPFTDVNADNPTVASFMSKPLKGLPKETAEALLYSVAGMTKMFETGDFEGFGEVTKPLYKFMADDIARQQKRLGGTFAVAHAVARRESRDYIRSLMGPDLVFIVLDTTLECMRERLSARHGGSFDDEKFAEAKKIYEVAGSDEENAYNVTIEKGMDKQDVLKAVLEVISKNNLA